MFSGSMHNLVDGLLRQSDVLFMLVHPGAGGEFGKRDATATVPS